MSSYKKLNLGSGSKPIEGYENIDGASGGVIFPLAFSEVSEIRASHVLEHFGLEESIAVLSNWIAALKPGGVIKIAVPDFDDLIRRYYLGEKINFEKVIMGAQTDERDFHKSIWTHSKLRVIMEGFGLENICTWQSEILDCAAYPFSLNLQGVKRA
jgi:predicted SAM-dependent methyltransferase